MTNFGSRISIGFLLVLAVTIILGGVSMKCAFVMESTASQETQSHEALRLLAELRADVVEAEAAQRGYMVTKDPSYTTTMESFIDRARSTSGQMQRTDAWFEQRQELRDLNQQIEALFRLFHERISDRQRMTLEEVVRSPTGNAVREHMQDLRERFVRLDGEQVVSLQERSSEMSRTVSAVKMIALVGVISCMVVIVATGVLLRRQLRSLVGASAIDLSHKAEELKVAATQQTSAAREMTDAANQLTMAMHEIQVSASQIAQRAFEVEELATFSSTAAQAGSHVMDRAIEAGAYMGTRIDQVVEQMSLLGRKVQGVVSVISTIEELAERTNILSINASVEAYAAGDHGVRFVAVADEIRRLAEQVRAEAVEINRELSIIRNMSNATILSTEVGAKAVASSAVLFGEAQTKFTDIYERVSASDIASKEIKLTTQHQSSATRQLDLALAKLQGASAEAERVAHRNLVTSGELTVLAGLLSTVVASASQQVRRGSGPKEWASAQ